MATDRVFRTDPSWLEAQQELTDDLRPGETPQDVLARSIAAAHRMYQIEVACSV